MREIDSVLTYYKYHYVKIGLVIFPFLISSICYLSGYYNKIFRKSFSNILLTTVISTFISTLLIYFIILINDNLQERNINYELILSLWLILVLCLIIPRTIFYQSIKNRIKNGIIQFNTIIIGDEQCIAQVTQSIEKIKDELGYNVIATLPYDFSTDRVESLCSESNISVIIIAPYQRSNSEMLHLVNSLFRFGIPIKIAPETYDIIVSTVRHINITSEPFINIAQSNMPEWEKCVKRASDIVLSAIALCLLSPVYLVIILLVNLESKGGAFYSQERIGKNGKPFKIYKFRTMYTDAEKDGIPKLSTESDKRITGIGHTLRKYRLDETPQFWNVLKGDMSLVGPRPERKYFADQIIARAPYYTLTYQIRPGLTSWGVVKYGYAKNIDEMISRAKYDLIYIDNMSLLIDLKIILYTVRTVITGKGI